jgi:putative ABC transport system permease protein
VSRATRPPRVAEWLLELTGGHRDRVDGVLGDLHEEFTGRAAASTARARAWYWLEAVSLSARFFVVAATSATRRRRERRPPVPDTGDHIVHTVSIEARYALRALVARPAMTTLIVLSLALGLGANATTFAMIDALVIHPFAFPQVDRVGFVFDASPTAQFKQESVSPANFLDWKAHAGGFESLSRCSGGT